jgi:hypothetical protein
MIIYSRPRIDLRELAHCRQCYEPMLFIYDSELRDYCYECQMGPIFNEERVCVNGPWASLIPFSLV